ncbi:efflux RND transporter periplasmic adaptor subunit [Chondrinema litorale]|uniref:efflux RND transporter periplasmic adaptor subunit n=1 Tax=Chondrinema litorale TaxID=2994555 RepID=UPI0025428CC9|nr:efflux RND transporter periplasmic adaptor subunit [Chondrinema litorale]UZR96883.1 efflux RND transporter periplasmic adaptor subunit [Chondrinema litorale]
MEISKQGSLLKNPINILLMLSGLVMIGCSSANSPDSAPASYLSVPVAHPVKMNITEWDEYSGRFRAMKRVEVRARVSGFIDAVKFKDGDMVKKGDVLFIIDQRPFNIALQQAKAQLEQAKAQEKQAQSSFERVKSLQGSKAISQEEFDGREQALYAASAQVEAARANVSNAELNLQFTVVRAPISGKVSEDYVNAGNLISGGTDQATLLTTIVSLDPIYFYFEGSESAFNKYSSYNEGNIEGSRVTIQLLGEEGFTHEGKLDFTDNEVDLGTGTIQARAILQNSDYSIESGMFGSAKLAGTGEHEAILIPDAVIGTDQSQKIVFVLADSNKVQAKPVQLGPLYNKDLRIVRSGLSTDDQIITGNILKIRPGMTVAPESREIVGLTKN